MACVLALMAAVLAGCGGSEQSESFGEEARKRGFQGREAATFANTREFCEMEPRSGTAVNEGLPADSGVVAIARRYAAEWPPKLRRAAFEGCKAGLVRAPARFPSSSPLARDVWGRHFVVTSVSGEDEEPPIARPIYIRLSFGTEKDHSVGWQASCNSFGGSVHFTATQMKVDQLGGTLVGCEPEVEEEDEWLTHFMEGDPEWHLEGEHLQLVADSGTIELKGFEDPNSCLISPDGGRVDLGNSQFDCESALSLATLYREGKERYLQGWECRDLESPGDLPRVVCRHGRSWFSVEDWNF